MRIYLLALLVTLCGCAPVKENRSQFTNGVKAGCSQNMESKGNSKIDSDRFCECLANIVVNDMSPAEYRLSVSNPEDEVVLLGVMIRNMEPVKQCEKLAPNAKY